jgi:hypothetical protein
MPLYVLAAWYREMRWCDSPSKDLKPGEIGKKIGRMVLL